MGKAPKAGTLRYVCRQKGCGKKYNDVIALATWHIGPGATCIPCKLAGEEAR